MSFTDTHPCMYLPASMNDSHGKQTTLVQSIQQWGEKVIGSTHSSTRISVVPLEGTERLKQY